VILYLKNRYKSRHFVSFWVKKNVGLWKRKLISFSLGAFAN